MRLVWGVRNAVVYAVFLSIAHVGLNLLDRRRAARDSGIALVLQEAVERDELRRRRALECAFSEDGILGVCRIRPYRPSSSGDAERGSCGSGVRHDDDAVSAALVVPYPSSSSEADAGAHLADAWTRLCDRYKRSDDKVQAKYGGDRLRARYNGDKVLAKHGSDKIVSRYGGDKLDAKYERRRRNKEKSRVAKHRGSFDCLGPEGHDGGPPSRPISTKGGLRPVISSGDVCDLAGPCLPSASGDPPGVGGGFADSPGALIDTGGSPSPFAVPKLDADGCGPTSDDVDLYRFVFNDEFASNCPMLTPENARSDVDAVLRGSDDPADVAAFEGGSCLARF